MVVFSTSFVALSERKRKHMKALAISSLIAVLASQYAIADVCDYRPSELIGGKTTTAVTAGAGVTAAAGTGMKAAGIYTLTHATTGATMLGSTAAGASAAGTTGIIAGTGGIIGSIGAVLLSPFVIIPTAVVAVGVVTYEGGCYLLKDKS